MSTTNIRIAEGLETRVTAAAERAGKTVPWSDARAYLEAWSRGVRARKPVARKLVR